MGMEWVGQEAILDSRSSTSTKHRQYHMWGGSSKVCSWSLLEGRWKLEEVNLEPGKG